MQTEKTLTPLRTNFGALWKKLITRTQDIALCGLMAKEQRPKTFWLGSLTFVYSFFLVCQGIWTKSYYLFIYPAVYDIIPGYDYRWIYAMGYFTEALVLIVPIVGGLIVMGVGYWLMFREEKPKMRWASVTLLVYSIVLIFQTIWVLFGYPSFFKELGWYASTNIFTNSPRFFILLGAVIPPLLGSILFMVVGLYLVRVRVKKESQPNSETSQIS